MAGLEDGECRTKFHQCLLMLECGPGGSLAMRIPSQIASRTLQLKRSWFYCRGRRYDISIRQTTYLPPSGIYEMTKIIHSTWIDERIPDSWRHAIIIPLHKKLSVADPKDYRGISLLRVMYKALEQSILDRLIKHREERTCDEQAGFRPGRSTIDQVLIVRRVIEIWQRYSKPMQLAFLDFEAVFDSPHRGHLLNALRAD
ncbi:hypothetical protein RB195_005735 [Necator americanus]